MRRGGAVWMGSVSPTRPIHTAPLLVTGAAGKTGLAVIRALAKRQTAVRALIRRESQRESVMAAGASSVVVGDMMKTAVYYQAAANCRAIYHICPNMHPDEIENGRVAIAAAQAAAVQQFVYHSVMHPHIEAMPHHWRKMRVEELLFASGLPCTILQPAAYMQNISASWPQITGNGIYRGLYRVPYAITAPFTLVDLHDVAQAAATVLCEDGHIGGIYELAGAERLTPAQMAAAMEQQLSQSVRAEQVIVPPDTPKPLRQMFDYYDQHGFVGGGWVLAHLLKRPSTSFASFLRRLKNNS